MFTLGAYIMITLGAMFSILSKKVAIVRRVECHASIAGKDIIRFMNTSVLSNFFGHIPHTSSFVTGHRKLYFLD